MYFGNKTHSRSIFDCDVNFHVNQECRSDIYYNKIERLCQIDILLFQTLTMGQELSKHSRITLSYYSIETHSVEGKVAIYRLNNQALLIFEKEKTSTAFAKVAENINFIKSPYLCSYMGNLFKHENIEIRQDCFCNSNEKDLSTFWLFQNYSLKHQILKNIEIGKLPEERDLWKLLKSMTEASNILMNHGIFIDCNVNNVHLSPLRNYELYWGSAKVGNGHRPYYQTLMGENVDKKTILAPQQFKGLNFGKLFAKLDLQKCVIYSIGILIIMYALNVTNQQVICDFEHLEIKKVQIVKIMHSLQKRLSPKLYVIIDKMIAQLPSKRMNFKDLLEIVRAKNISYVNEKLPTQSDTCSSKVSVKNIKY